MVKKVINNASLYVKTSGEGSDVIVFSHGYLMNHSMFDGQIEKLKQYCQCISYDHRGHGQSEVTSGGYEMDNLVNDAIALIESLEVGAVHFVGMSTGGFVGMRIALRRPELLKSLVLMDTSAGSEPRLALIKYKVFTWAIKNIGWWPALPIVMSNLFYKSFLNDKSRQQDVADWKRIVSGHNKNGIIPFSEGIFARDDVLDKLDQLTLPVAVVVGEYDVPTPPHCSEKMATAIKGATLYRISNAGHSAAVEKPNDVANALLEFYKSKGFIQA